jgi:hypothetical protein
MARRRAHQAVTATPRRRFTKARGEILAIEKLVGPADLRPLPVHIWCRALIESGRASPELLAAAEHAQQYWAAVTLPSLRTTGEHECGGVTQKASTLAGRSGRPTSGVPGAAPASPSTRLTRSL